MSTMSELNAKKLSDAMIVPIEKLRLRSTERSSRAGRLLLPALNIFSVWNWRSTNQMMPARPMAMGSQTTGAENG